MSQLLLVEPEVFNVPSGGSSVELLVWGDRGLPGLFLLHGAGAHAHWWDAVAPLLAGERRVAAMSLPGNGGSQWRDRYSSKDVFDDVLACVDAAALADSGSPMFIGHSMGGAHLMHGAMNAPDAMGGLILVDTSFRAPGRKPMSGRGTSRRIFTTETEAISRFHLVPQSASPQEPLLLEHVARHSLIRIAGPTGEPGWCWRADPDYWSKFVPGIEQGPYPAPLCPKLPTVHLVAEHSHVAMAAACSPLCDEIKRITMPDCGHHAMLERPIELVATLKALLSAWP